MICGTCGGSKTQHATDEEGCWCENCLDPNPWNGRTGRCTEFVAAERPAVDRNVAPVGKRHPKTAKRAAERTLPRTGSRRSEVLNLVRRAGEQGMTDDEIEAVTGQPHQTISAARNTLAADGWVIDSGLRRATRNGQDAIAWKAVAG